MKQNLKELHNENNISMEVKEMAKVNFKGEIETTGNNATYIADQIENLVNQHNGNVDVQTTTEDDISRLKERIKEIVENNFRPNDDGGIEIYCHYDDELSDRTIKKIMQSDNPRQTFSETLWEFDDSYEWSNLFDTVKRELKDNDEELYLNNQTEMSDFIYETYSFYYPEEHFNKSVKVNIMLDTGNLNYDFTCDNVLNWDGQHSGGEFDNNSSMLWLAKQQGKATLLRKCCKESMRKWKLGEQRYKETTECTDKFVISAMQELANLTSHMGVMTFLVEMELFDLFKLKEAIALEEELNNSYELEKRKGTGYIVLDKSTMCGLFNTWSGGGSVLEIDCEKDIKIPIRCIWDAVVDGTKIYGYDVDEVYGLMGSAWQDTLKEIHPMEI